MDNFDEEEKKYEQMEAIRNEAYKVNTHKNTTETSRGFFPELGICEKCGNMRGVVTEFGLRSAQCTATFSRLTGKQKIKHCTSFWNVSYADINSLLPMAIFIDPKKEKIGF